MHFKNKKDGINYFEKLGYEIKEGPNWFLIIPSKEELLKAKNESKRKMPIRNCNLCGSMFEFGSARQHSCLHCILYVECNNCNIYFKSSKNTKYIIEQVENKYSIESFCSKDCSNKFNIIKAHNVLEQNPEIRINIGKKNIQIANKYWEENKEKRLENLQKANEYWKNNPEEAKEQRKRARTQANETLKHLWADEEWSKRQKEIVSNNCKVMNENWDKNPELRKQIASQNIKKSIEAQKYLWENDEQWIEKQRKILSENGKQYGQYNLKYAMDALKILWENEEWSSNMRKILSKNGKENIEKANKVRLERIKEILSNLNLVIHENSIDINNILILRKQRICGAYIIKAKFKNDINTKQEGTIYKLLACKSRNIYDEIYWVLKVISAPEKQDKENESWTIRKWWYIANLYYDFEFEILTDPKGVSEKEALLYEAKYAVDNNMFVEFEENKEPKISKHAYFSI